MLGLGLDAGQKIRSCGRMLLVQVGEAEARRGEAKRERRQEEEEQQQRGGRAACWKAAVEDQID